MHTSIRTVCHSLDVNQKADKCVLTAATSDVHVWIWWLRFIGQICIYHPVKTSVFSGCIYITKQAYRRAGLDIPKKGEKSVPRPLKRKTRPSCQQTAFLSHVVWKLSQEKRSRWPFCPFQTTLEPTVTGRSFLGTGRAEHKPLKQVLNKQSGEQTVWLRLHLCCSPEQQRNPAWFISARWDKTLPSPLC